MNATSLGNPAVNEQSLTKAQIYDLIKQKVPYKKICEMTGYSKGYISQIKKEFEEKEDRGNGNFVYIEYKDHLVVDNAEGLHGPLILACIGEISLETDDALHIKQIWNKSLGKEIRYNVIVKSTIIKQIYLDPRTSEAISSPTKKISPSVEPKQRTKGELVRDKHNAGLHGVTNPATGKQIILDEAGYREYLKYR